MTGHPATTATCSRRLPFHQRTGPQKAIYGLDADNNLVTINARTAVTKVVGNIGLPIVPNENVTLFTSLSNGKLFALDPSNKLYSINSLNQLENGGISWRQLSRKLDVPMSTVIDACRSETLYPQTVKTPANPQPRPSISTVRK